MKKILFVITLLASIILNLGLMSSIDKIDAELIVVKQLHDVQQQMLEDNFSENELDSLYLEYNYYYLNNYYKNNY